MSDSMTGAASRPTRLLVGAAVCAALMACGGGGGASSPAGAGPTAGGAVASGAGNGSAMGGASSGAGAAGSTGTSQWTGTILVGTSSLQHHSPAMARLSDDRTAVAWLAVPGGQPQLHVKTYNDAGTEVGAGFSMPIRSQAPAGSTSLAASGSGYVVTWCEYTERSPYPGWDTYMLAVDGQGAAEGEPVQLNSSASNTCRPTLTALAGGRIAVTQLQASMPNHIPGFRAPQCVVQVYQGRQLVGQSDLGYATACEAAALPDGTFAVVHAQINMMGERRVLLSRFDSAGAALGGSANLVEPTSTADRLEASLAALPNGQLAVVWASSDSGLWFGRFTAGGDRVQAPVQVDSATNASPAAIAAATDGSVALTWHRSNQANQADILAQLFDAAGAARGDRITLGTSFGGLVPSPRSAVVPSSGGRWMFGWQAASEASGAGVYIRRH